MNLHQSRTPAKTLFWYLEERIDHLVINLSRAIAKQLVNRNIELACQKFLNGIQIWVYFAGSVFYRLGQYVGHGLCYEASALEMLLWRDEPTTRYCFASCRGRSAKTRVDHSWIEFKAYGIWWVIDATWYPPCPFPRFWHSLSTGARYHRIISHDEFWSIPFAEEFYNKLSNPKTSYLFYELTLFRHSARCAPKMEWEVNNVFELSQVGFSGVYPSCVLYNVFSKKHPVTPSILRHFLVNPKATLPKRHDYRHARILSRRILAYLSQAKTPA